MTAVGRALMAQPSMILLDEPSMGLAPQIVEEIFEIVRDLNGKEGVSFLLAEQNTMVALRFANYGYILENGRVVMDGEASDLASNEDVKEFYLGLVVRRPQVLPRRQALPPAQALARLTRRRARVSHHWLTISTRWRRATPSCGNARSSRRCRGRSRTRRPHAPAFARILADVDAAAVTSRAALTRLPVTRKSALLDMQKGARPFGGLAATGWGPGTRRVFASPGPIYEPEGARPDYWRLARPLFAAGFRRGRSHPQLLLLPLHAGRLDARNRRARAGLHGVSRRHRADRAAGAGNGRSASPRATSARRRFCGSSSRRPTSRAWRCRSSRTRAGLRRSVPAVVARRARRARHRRLPGLRDRRIWARSPMKRSAREGLVVDEGVIVEIVRPGTGDPVAPGEVGEVVVTTLTNTDYPLIRFGTGDLSALLPGLSPCGRTNMRIKGWMGRADQTTKVKGMFVHPSQVAAIVGPASGDREGAARRRQSRRQRPHDAARRGRRRSAAGRGRDRRIDPRRHQAARRSHAPTARRACPTTARSSTTCASSNERRSEGTGEYSAISALIATARRRVRLAHDDLHAGNLVPREGGLK